MLSAELGEKCDAIGKKLLYLEDQLHTAIRSHDDDLIHILFIVHIKHQLGYLVKASLKKINNCPTPQQMEADRYCCYYRSAHLRSQIIQDPMSSL